MTTFVDTNVLVYARDDLEPEKQPVAQGWLEYLWNTGAGRTGIQVLNEYYINVTRNVRQPMAPEAARSEIADPAAWQPVGIDENLVAAAWEIEDRYGFHFWDALVVAAAQAAGCDALLTEDLQDGQDLDGVVVVNPFLHPPPERD